MRVLEVYRGGKRCLSTRTGVPRNLHCTAQSSASKRYCTCHGEMKSALQGHKVLCLPRNPYVSVTTLLGEMVLDSQGKECEEVSIPAPTLFCVFLCLLLIEGRSFSRVSWRANHIFLHGQICPTRGVWAPTSKTKAQFFVVRGVGYRTILTV